MTKLDIKLSRWMIYGIYAMFLLTALNTCNSCNKSSTLKNMDERLNNIDSTMVNKASKEDVVKMNQQILLQMEIEGLKASKRTLYDENAVVRTSIRPDDRMNEYDQDIKKLEDKLKSIK